MADYLFELLTEEIPAWMHDAAAATLTQRLIKIAEESGVEGDAASAVTVSTTPRRIAFHLTRLPLREADRDVELKGPPKKSAYDAAGAPTQALLGFLRKNSATVDDLVEAGDYIQLKKRVAGRGTDELLRDKIPALVESLRWPKMMRWGRGEYSYIRPIHSVISVFDAAHLPISIFGVASGTTTTGHRTLAPQSIEVESYSDYLSKMELARVVIDTTRRRHVMAERARILASEVGGSPSTDASIWSQWQYLTEYPGVVRAEFRPEYLAIPEEVLVTVMRVHQKQLPIRDAAGKLTSYFLAVLDNEGDPDGNAAYGNSFVTNARFADARFFYETDRKKPLSERLDSLSHLQFQEKLGNYLDKTRRIESIAAAICRELKIDDAASLAAARLCKADLVTEMVKEFTELQGKIGGIYAREEKQPEDVWQAIYDHYLPVNTGDPLPRTMSGAVVALADKIDTLAGFFSVGARPTGSKDPFALRRAALGAVQILFNRTTPCVPLGIDRLIAIGVAAHQTSNAAELEKDLLAFFEDRVRNLFETFFAYDEVAAGMESGWSSSLHDLLDRVTALRSVRNDPNFLSILDSAKRIENITAGHTSESVDPSLLELDTERRLSDLASLVVEQINELVAAHNHRGALESFAAMAPELETFFRDVLVMVDNEAVRKNRMSLLRKVGSAARSVADVTKIVVDRRDYQP